MAIDNSHPTGPAFGRGLNSLRIRFTLMVAIFCLLVATMASLWLDLEHPHLGQLEGWGRLLLVSLAIGSAAGMTFFMTGKLTRPIENLRASTEAIAKGAYDTVVSVDCQCEVGGLADSFRMMVARLNDNVARINTLAYEDGVTGLPNRAALDAMMQDIGSMTGFLLFIDLDRFRQVNDIYGHQTGDRLLRLAARRLLAEGLRQPVVRPPGLVPSSAPRSPDSDQRLLFCFAGDEYVALVTGQHSHEDISTIALRLTEVLAEPFVIDDCIIHIGGSIGIAEIGRDGDTQADLLKFADMAMTEAKKRGRGRYVFFDDTMREAAQDRAELESDFSRAIERGELEVHYQPKFLIRDGSISGLEALVRWRHPQRGLLYPGSFLPIVMATGSMGVLGQEVMAIAARDVARLRAEGQTYRISINVCPTQFADDDFAERLTRYVASLGAASSSFEIEVTETLAMADIDKARQHLVQLKAAGFTVSIDDFGTGFSNLAQLTKLPYDCLKIDRSLIVDIATNPDSRTILAAIVTMAHGLGHSVVAEGVEDAEQLEILALLGCDIIQGYLLGRPVPFHDLPHHRIAQAAQAH